MPVAFECTGHEGVHTFGICDVQLCVLGQVAGLGQLLDKQGETLDPAGAEDDLVARGGQMACGGLTDTAGSADHQNDLAVGDGGGV